MKPILKLFLFCSIIFFSLFTNAQEKSKKELVIIRVLELRTGFIGALSPIMHITENDGSYRTIKLDGHSKDYLLDPTEIKKKFTLNLKNILTKDLKLLNMLKEEIM